MEKDLLQLFDDYIDETRFSGRLSGETIRGYKNVFCLFLKVMPEVTTKESLTQEMLNEFFKRIETRQRIVGKNILKTGVKKSTIKTQYSKLNVFFVWLKNKGFIEENPLKNIKPPAVVYDDHPRLEDNEIHKLYSAVVRNHINSLTFRRDTMIVSLLLFCGLRKGELISLQVRDIDIEKKEITIRKETSKSNRTRIIVIHPTLLMHIKDYIKERNLLGLNTEALVVSNRGDAGLSKEGFRHWVKGLIKKSGVKFHFHQFRHTFTCKLSAANVNTLNICKLLGHASVITTEGYVRSMRTQDMASEIAKITI